MRYTTERCSERHSHATCELIDMLPFCWHTQAFSPPTHTTIRYLSNPNFHITPKVFLLPSHSASKVQSHQSLFTEVKAARELISVFFAGFTQYLLCSPRTTLRTKIPPERAEKDCAAESWNVDPTQVKFCFLIPSSCGN